MDLIEEGQTWIIESIGIIFLIVGASKWLYDVIILNNFTYWKVYMVMILVGGMATGYLKIEKALTKVLSRV